MSLYPSLSNPLTTKPLSVGSTLSRHSSPLWLFTVTPLEAGRV